MKDLVSIITPTYNSEKYISVTINSILSQTYSNFELIIIDDFSTDNTVECVKKFDDKSVLSNDFQKQVIDHYKAIRPFFDYMTNVLITDLNGVSLL